MAASLEEVIQEVQDSDDDKMSSEIGEGEREKDKDKLGNWLKNFPGNSSFNRALFEDARREVLRPLIHYPEMLELYRTRALTGTIER